MQETEVKVKSLKKALSILECFSVEMPEMGITQISDRLGLHKSGVHNIISTFEQCGYIAQNPDTGKYRLDMKILELAFVINSSLGIHGIVHSPMTALSEAVGEAVYCAMPKGPEIIYLEGAYPITSHMTRSMIGEKAEMYCTAIGKAILAFLPEPEATRAMAQQSMRQHTENTITDRTELAKEIAVIRRRGYSMDNMEHEHGIKCVGVPVFRRDGTLLGAISISGPSLRVEDEKVSDFVRQLQDCAQQIRMRL